MTEDVSGRSHPSKQPLASDGNLRGCKLENNKLTEAEWKDRGVSLGESRSNLQWQTGDWWIAAATCDRRTRKAIVEADDWPGPAYQTAMNAGRVCRAFPPSRRREVLSFAHHEAVAGLESDDADRLLDWAVECRASVHALRKKRDSGGLNRRSAVARASTAGTGKISGDPPAKPVEPSKPLLLPFETIETSESRPAPPDAPDVDLNLADERDDGQFSKELGWQTVVKTARYCVKRQGQDGNWHVFDLTDVDCGPGYGFEGNAEINARFSVLNPLIQQVDNACSDLVDVVCGKDVP